MPRINPGPPCQVCGEPSHALKLCQKHYMRYRRNGTTNQTRPADWGQRESHPLWHSWSWTKRVKEGRVPEWDDFWTFVEDVGARPDGHTLRRTDNKKPFGPDNCYWKEKIPSADKAEYQRRWRKEHPEYSKAHSLKKQFDITLQEYDAMVSAAGGVCQICKQPEMVYNNLAVDHCHTTGKIRGVLCHKCNTGIGSLRDDPDILKSAIVYLTT